MQAKANGLKLPEIPPELADCIGTKADLSTFALHENGSSAHW